MSPYSRLLLRVLLPLHNAIRGRHYVDYRRLLEESQWWDRGKLLEFQWRELDRLLDHVFANIPYYQLKYAAAGIRREDIQGPEDFARLPILTRQEIREYREELRAGNVAGVRPHATGGSSGAPTRFYITIDSYDWRMAASHRAYNWSGYNLGERVLYLWGAPLGSVPYWKRIKVSLHNSIQGQWIVNTFSQSPELWREVYELACRKRPVWVIGYVSSVEAFGKYLREQGLRMPPLRAVLTGAEPLHETTRKDLEAAFFAPVFNTYGSREFMSIGVECGHHKGLHINAENILLETAQPASQDPSDILVTDLHNYGMPFLRYQIGDMGLLDDTPCACGRGLPRVGSIEGREPEVLRTPSGRIVPGEIFPHLMKEFPEVREFQVRQVNRDRLVLSLVLADPLTGAHRVLIDQELMQARPLP